MKKSKKLATLLLTMFLAVFMAMAFMGNAPAQKIDTNDNGTDPIGLYVNISLTLNVQGTVVTATAKNQFTLFPATVRVYVRLYTSETYTEDLTKMTRESQNYIYDLDQGQSISTTADIGGRRLYWRAQAYYQMDNNAWKSLETPTYLLDTDGSVIK